MDPGHLQLGLVPARRQPRDRERPGGPPIAGSEILVETRLRNRSAAAVSFGLAHRRVEGGERVATPIPAAHAGRGRVQGGTADPGDRALLWTPETPSLYVLDSSTGGDSLATRFGIREFRFDTATRRSYLNGKLYFLRGGNITLHRFFEDPEWGRPWDETWVRRMLAELPER